MTRLELLQLVIGRARSNGFELRRWYTGRLGLPWISLEASLVLLDSQKRYYALVFSHEFAQTFWKPGSEITFQVPQQVFERVMPDGSTRTVERRAFMRRSLRQNAWKYHLKQMAMADEPLRYLRKYLRIEGDLNSEQDVLESVLPDAVEGRLLASKRQAAMKPLPPELPAFLQRPYRPGVPRPLPRRNLLP